jgi:BirA family transcriptional regulator, biotin operon repressor / biotin---[acetyl-CoA-carboxylase] ligase
LDQLGALLTTNWLGRGNNEFHKTIDSTNDRALELARKSNAHGALIVATEQTAGRGRNGREWFSPAGSGLYMSFLVQPEMPIANLPVITLITGVAVAKGIQKCLNIRPGLKWVNDLIVDGKKIGGILCEYQNPAALIIGIGLNLYESNDIPADLIGKISFLDSCVDQSIDPNNVIASIANELESALDQMQSGNLQILLDQWRAYSITLGEEIVAHWRAHSQNNIRQS